LEVRPDDDDSGPNGDAQRQCAIMSGFFISFEGVEGCGKSTQLALLHAWIQQRGLPVLQTREPGGVPIAEEIREILLNPAHTAMAAPTELLLYAAARAQHVHERVRPALAAGTHVLCDRYADSTFAYQGAGRKLEPEVLDTLHHIATGGLWPHLTFVLDLPAAEGLARTRSRGRADRIERETLAFHERVRQGFLTLAAREPGRIVVLDATPEPEAIAPQVQAHVEALLHA